MGHKRRCDNSQIKRLLRNIYLIGPNKNDINDLQFTSDGKTLVSCSSDKMIRIWDSEKGT